MSNRKNLQCRLYLKFFLAKSLANYEDDSADGDSFVPRMVIPLLANQDLMPMLSPVHSELT